MEILRGRLPNPNFKVFFIAIFRIKQAMRLNFGINMEVEFNLPRRNVENESEHILI